MRQEEKLLAVSPSTSRRTRKATKKTTTTSTKTRKYGRYSTWCWPLQRRCDRRSRFSVNLRNYGLQKCSSKCHEESYTIVPETEDKTNEEKIFRYCSVTKEFTCHFVHCFERYNSDQHQQQQKPQDTSDPESSTGQVRNTAFRVESREYHHAAPVAIRHRTTNKLLDTEVSTEKHEIELLEQRYRLVSSDSTRRIQRGNTRSQHFDARGLRTKCDKPKFTIHADQIHESLEMQRGCSKSEKELDVSRFHNFESWKLSLPHEAPDNTAFKDIDDNCYVCKHCWLENYEILSCITGDGTRKRRLGIIETPERSWKLAKSEISLQHQLIETNTCLDLPGGRFYDVVLRNFRSRTNIDEATKMSASNGNSEFPSTKKLDNEQLGVEMEKGCEVRIFGSSDDRETRKKPRKRRRRKYTDDRRRRADESCTGDDDDDDRNDDVDDDDDVSLDNSKVESCDKVKNDFTARSGEPVVKRFDKSRIRKRRNTTRRRRGRRRKSASPFSENTSKTKVAKLSGKLDSSNVKQTSISRTRAVGKINSGTRRKWGVRCYGLLFVLYLLALPILCSTVPSGNPVASAFAQKSPLTQGDNFTARNLSLQQHGHQTRRDSVTNEEKTHPYNEYTWEVNQINPWLSACDLAGPAPADLQGSCGPPEVPKNCPLPCPSASRGDVKRAFHDVIESLGIHDRAKSGAGGSRWRPSGTNANKSNRKKNNDDDDNGNKRTLEAGKAPEQCLFYLEASHKRDICHDNFGIGSSLSFSNPRENRYWYVSGLRLRHCCEHAVVNALAPGNGGPLEDVLNGGARCSEALEKLLLVDALAARLHCEFEEVLARYDCGQSYSVIHNCTHCKEAYRKWVCSSLVPYFAHGGPSVLDTTMKTWYGTRLRPCRSFCQSVEQRCPYLLPGDRAPAYPTQYAGEPTFLCRDPNIPETGEQAMRALHGNEDNECCFRVCSEDEPGSGVCANCTDLHARSNHAGHDIPTAPQCEITTTSSVHSGSTGDDSNAGSILSDSTSPDPSASSSTKTTTTTTTTSASFCSNGGGAGPITSSSGQSTTKQTPKTFTITLLCIFWLWNALISLCNGQTVYPRSPPSSSSSSSTSTIDGNRRNDDDIATNKRTISTKNKSTNSSSNSSSVVKKSFARTYELISMMSLLEISPNWKLLSLVLLKIVSLSRIITGNYCCRSHHRRLLHHHHHRRCCCYCCCCCCCFCVIVNFFIDSRDTFKLHYSSCRTYFFVKFDQLFRHFTSSLRSYEFNHSIVVRYTFFNYTNNNNHDDNDEDDDNYKDDDLWYVIMILRFYVVRWIENFGKQVTRPPRGKLRKKPRRRRRRRRKKRQRIVSISSFSSSSLLMHQIEFCHHLPIKHYYYYYYYYYHCYYYYYYYYYYGASTWWWWWSWWWWWCSPPDHPFIFFTAPLPSILFLPVKIVKPAYRVLDNSTARVCVRARAVVIFYFRVFLRTIENYFFVIFLFFFVSFQLTEVRGQKKKTKQNDRVCVRVCYRAKKKQTKTQLYGVCVCVLKEKRKLEFHRQKAYFA